MAEPTLTNGAGTTFTFAAGEVNQVRAQVAADVEQTAFPGSGPISAFNFDFNGPLKIITISGQLALAASTRTDAGSVTTILEQKQWLEENINGSQTSTAFTSTYEGQTFDGSSYQSTTVMVGQVDFSENSGNPLELPFTMQLLVGA